MAPRIFISGQFLPVDWPSAPPPAPGSVSSGLCLRRSPSGALLSFPSCGSSPVSWLSPPRLSSGTYNLFLARGQAAGHIPGQPGGHIRLIVLDHRFHLVRALAIFPSERLSLFEIQKSLQEIPGLFFRISARRFTLSSFMNRFLTQRQGVSGDPRLPQVVEQAKLHFGHSRSI